MSAPLSACRSSPVGSRSPVVVVVCGGVGCWCWLLTVPSTVPFLVVLVSVLLVVVVVVCGVDVVVGGAAAAVRVERSVGVTVPAASYLVSSARTFLARSSCNPVLPTGYL